MTEVEIDPQAFLTGEPEIVTGMRAKLVETLTPLACIDAAGIEAVLTAAAQVPHRGDDDAYVAEAKPVVIAAIDAATKSWFEAEATRLAALRAETDRLAKAQADLEEFWKMKAHDTIQ